MKFIILTDCSDDQSQMPVKSGCSKDAIVRVRRIMKFFELWRVKQQRLFQLVLWHTHFPHRFTPPNLLSPLCFDCEANLFEKQREAIVKNYTPNEPIIIADDSHFFDDNFDFEPLIEKAMQPESGIVFAQKAWILNPKMQQAFGDISEFEKEWTEADFVNWISATTWTFAKTYAETSPHEYAVFGKPNTELSDLYKATMFILRNGFVQMYYQTPFMAYEVGNRRYWADCCYNIVNRSLEGDLRIYQ